MQNNKKISRRHFLQISGASVASVATACARSEEELPPKEVGQYTLPYPRQTIAQAAALQQGEPLVFQYPDADSPCMLLKMGERVPGGVGPLGDIVGYSILCSHQGCPVVYNSADRLFECNCHFSTFDPERHGQMVCGQATVNLPRILLEYAAETDEIVAVSVSGLIYGRVANVLTEEVSS